MSNNCQCERHQACVGGEGPVSGWLENGVQEDWADENGKKEESGAEDCCGISNHTGFSETEKDGGGGNNSTHLVMFYSGGMRSEGLANYATTTLLTA